MMNRLMTGVAVLAFSMAAHAFDLESTLKDALNKGVASQPTAAPTSAGGGVDQLKPKEINSGIKEALTRGAEAAVAQLGKPDGFMGNDALRIPLPSGLQKGEKIMRTMGMGKQADELILSMNRAAEAAVPEAKTLLVKSVREMTLEDARGILTGGDTAATDFFRRKTEAPLTKRFGPIVKKATDRVGLAQQYDKYAGTAAQFGAIDKNQATVEQYVTQQALDRLYKVIGEQERSLRANPMQAGSALLQKVFGAIGGR
ncbi:conserved exported protein of unknown function [Georgfuchsia toluolica]|uniref:DUF4197 domain-containing protein n=1 Tax=Georgfuchsia toluolica TaxID=424218 RepID=A0A916J5Z8_9PROT|nr:DUF4197 domain-containing protein [Georgfuchsia toluolica]CAG4884613.1 conserved exported protein of unknown function [Georgfuchsia toluolica]